MENTGNAVEAVYEGLIEGFDLRGLVAGCLRIDVRDIAVRRIQLHVYVFGLVEALQKETGRDQQHEGERGLQNHQGSLQE